ncbi:hypothetical protein B9Z55_017461 [Caenorhabditis nigoni]|uniref:F-box associated domain-containing protein n=1 Tax=Caenorhabditis nigoni TaxID=1611254 RepID=A0A2G5T9S8_9PELO|nr:hypothetical protein B9Z55_017461 [Caenorhabditis nigoni]
MSLFAHINFSKLPVPTVGEAFWKCTKIDEFLNLATNTPHSAWFQKIAVAPTKFSVNFEAPPEARARNHWEIQMEFQDHGRFIWRFYRLPDNFDDATMKLKFGQHNILSKLEPGNQAGDSPVLHSYITEHQTGFLEIVDWLRKFFKCEPTDIKIRNRCITNYDEILHWQPLLNTPKLAMMKSKRSQFITELLEKRHEKQLRTRIDVVDIRHPQSVSIEGLSSLDYHSGHIDFSDLDSNFVTEYIRNFLGQENERFLVLRAAIPDWTRDQVDAFGADLNLEHFDVDLNRTHKPGYQFHALTNDSRMFQIRKDERSVLVFHFSRPTLRFGNVVITNRFDKMAITVWLLEEPQPRD